MDQTTTVKNDLASVANEVARAISYAETEGTAAFVTTAVSYPNGSAVVVRIDESHDGYFVSDDGYAALSADMMGGIYAFNKVAENVAKRFGVQFDQRAFFVLHVTRDQLPGAVTVIANASSVSVERTIYAMDEQKIKRSRVMFEDRLRSAFGSKVIFGERVAGATSKWKFGGVVMDHSRPVAVFEFVAPEFNSVAATNLKFGDVRSMGDGPSTVAALADYDHTASSLRSILSNVADRVIPVTDDPEAYRKAA